jgi:hypothetical protein
MSIKQVAKMPHLCPTIINIVLWDSITTAQTKITAGNLQQAIS